MEIKEFIEELKREESSEMRRYIVKDFADRVERGEILLDGIKRSKDVFTDIEEYFNRTAPEIAEMISKTIKAIRRNDFLRELDSELYESEPNLDKIETEFLAFYSIYRKDKDRNLELTPYSEVELYKMISHILEKHYSNPEDETLKRRQQRILYNLYQNRAISRIESTEDASEKQRIYGIFIRDFVEGLNSSEEEMSYIEQHFEGEPFVKAYNNAKKCEKYGIEYVGEPITIYEATEEEAVKVNRKNEERAAKTKDERFDISRLVLVRTTNTIPRAGIVETIDKHTEPVYGDSLFRDEIKKAGLDLDDFQMCNFMSRRTIHWTLNGLVQSHMLGDFKNRNYIIIEPFEEHTNDRLLNISETDTYFEQDLKLSDRAIVLMPVERYKEIIQDEDKKAELERYKIALFTGDEETAVHMLLEEQGYIYGNLGTREFSYFEKDDLGIALQKLQGVMKSEAEELGVDFHYSHFHSSTRTQDRLRMEDLNRERISKFVDFLAENSDVNFSPEYLKSLFIGKFVEDIEHRGYEVKEEETEGKKLERMSAEEVFELIGAEKIKELTKQFNQKTLEEYKKARKEKDEKLIKDGLATKAELEGHPHDEKVK